MNSEFHIKATELQGTGLIQGMVAVSTRLNKTFNILIESLLSGGLPVGERLRHHFKHSLSYCALRQQLETERGERGHL